MTSQLLLRTVGVFPSQFAAHEQQQSSSQENELFLDVTIAWAEEYTLPPRLPCANASEGPLLSLSRVFSVHIQFSHYLFIGTANE